MNGSGFRNQIEKTENEMESGLYGAYGIPIAENLPGLSLLDRPPWQ